MRTWLEIDLDKMAHNIDTVKEILPDECQIIAVVKANAYGHGDVRIAKFLEEQGINFFAVATFSEAMALRESGIDSEILVLSYVDPEDAVNAALNNITLCGVSREYVNCINEKLEGRNLSVKMHLKLNTGMNRVGFECFDESCYSEIETVYTLPNIEFTGIFSHFSSSDDLSDGADEYSKLQMERFVNTTNYLKSKGINIGIRHLSNSGGIGKYEEARFDAVRCGALMYGYNTALDAKLPVRPVATWKAVISCVRTLNKGDAVSYSRHYIAKGGEKVATICIGYADGYKRSMSGREDGAHGYVLINGVKCPILGNICMDQMMADVTGLDVKMGDIAVLMNDEYTADDIGEYALSCMHDVLSSISERVDRIYIEK